MPLPAAALGPDAGESRLPRPRCVRHSRLRGCRRRRSRLPGTGSAGTGMPLAAATAGAVRVLTVTSPGGRAMSCLAPEPDPITQPVSAASRERAYLVDEVCPFCADDQSLAGGLHPDVPLAPVWAGSHWRLFADLTAEAIGCCLLAPPRPVASVTEMEPGEASQLGNAASPGGGAAGRDQRAGGIPVCVRPPPPAHPSRAAPPGRPPRHPDHPGQPGDRATRRTALGDQRRIPAAAPGHGPADRRPRPRTAPHTNPVSLSSVRARWKISLPWP
jgi:hypothetical protein